MSGGVLAGSLKSNISVNSLRWVRAESTFHVSLWKDFHAFGSVRRRKKGDTKYRKLMIPEISVTLTGYSDFLSLIAVSREATRILMTLGM